MAIQTHQLGGDDTYHFELDWDDAKNIVVALRCVNNRSTSVQATLYRNSDNQFIQGEFLPGTSQIGAPQSPRTSQFPVTVLPNGKLDGFTLIVQS